MMLTPRQKRFAEEYCIDLNATQAAIRAGYSPKTAGGQASRLLSNAGVKNVIEHSLEQIRTANIAAAQEVEEYLTKVLRGESTSEIVVIEGVGEGCSSARRITKAPDERERLKAAEILAKRHGLLETRFKFNGALPVFFTGEAELMD